MRSSGGSNGGLAAGLNLPSLSAIPISYEEINKNKFLLFCAFLNLVTVVLALLSCVLQVLLLVDPCYNNAIDATTTTTEVTEKLATAVDSLPGIKNSYNENKSVILTFTYNVCRIFSIFLCILVTFQEKESTSIFSQFSFLQSWVSRGLFLFFLASMQIIIYDTSLYNGCQNSVIDKSQLVTSGAIMLLGALYFALGLCCFNQLRQRQLTQIRKRKQAQMQAQSLSAHKNEIEKLLQETERKMQNL